MIILCFWVTFIYLQFSKHFMLLIESVFAIPVKISGFSFQNQMVRLMNYINDSLELVTFLIDNALIALLCLCICIVISRYSKVSS